MRRAASRIVQLNALGYNETVHKHLRRLERVWIDAPIYFVTACTKGRRQVLAHDHVAHIWSKNGGTHTSGTAGQLVGTS